VAQEDVTLYSDEDNSCVHHWLIDAENIGVCKKCSSVRQFRGWWDVAAIRKGWSRNPDSGGGSSPGSNSGGGSSPGSK
jgi:hypothetical protein